MSNFLSFKDLQEFSMIAGHSDDHKFHTYRDTVDVLDRAIIYGPNSSGKSNFVNAIAYAQNVICGNNNRMWVKYRPKTYEDMSYMSKDIVRDPISYFEFLIQHNSRLYSYGFEYDTKLKLFHSEWLVELYPDDSERNIFKLYYNNGACVAYLGADNETVLNRSSANESYLASSEGEASEIFQWFTEKLLVVLTAYDDFGDEYELSLSKDDLFKIMKYLKILDTGICGIQAEDPRATMTLQKEQPDLSCFDEDELKEYADKGWFSQGNVYRILDEFNVRYSYDQFHIEFGRKVDSDLIEEYGDEFYLLPTSDIHNNYVKEYGFVDFVHEPGNFLVEYLFESEGTKKILELLLLFHNNGGKKQNNTACLNKNNVVTIIYDEFECSIHTLIIRELMRIYDINKKTHNFQFITTTHDSRLLDYNIYRSDEIWLIDSINESESVMYSLDSFDKFNSDGLGEKYLRGIFGAIPNISSKIEEEL